ncbi:MAG: class I SAM-dependent methyltransferase [Deltaproteobacteria bacterium]|nr:class I SAM-dependent methyltransferase [Deltaproteobacteria bacterium]
MTEFDNAAFTWDENPGRIEMAENSLNNILYFFQEEGVRGRKILDFGSGTGLIAVPLAHKGARLWCYDTSEKMMDVLNQKLKNLSEEIKIHTTTVIEEISGEVFDAAIISMALHHSEDWKETLRFLSSLLDKNGYLIIVDLETENGNFHSDNFSVHKFGFDSDEIKSMMGKLGLTPVHDSRIKTVIRERKDKSKVSGEYHIRMWVGKK